MTIDEIIENFSLLDEWDDRYRYVIELGRMLTPLPEQARAVAAGSSSLGFSQAGYVVDGTFLKLREASVTYYAPEVWARALRATSMQISLTGRNLLKWTNYDGIDPEVNGNGQFDFADDFLTAPPIRTLAVRVSLGF